MKRIRNVLALALVASTMAISPIAAAQDAGSPGDDGFSQVCASDNWKKVGFETYEDCVASWGEPEEPKPSPGGGGSWEIWPIEYCYSRCW